jgi:hypothetical protein
MAEFHSVLLASISTAHISIQRYTIMSYWLHSAELQDGAHHSAALSALKIGILQRPLLRSVKGGGDITNSMGEGPSFFKTLLASKLIRIFITPYRSRSCIAAFRKARNRAIAEFTPHPNTAFLWF